jgi:capsid protein
LNARAAYHDTPQAHALVNRYADTVADTGLRLEAAPKAGILGLTQEEAEVWAQDIEARYDLYMRDKKQHRSETITGYQSQRLYQIQQHRDNDIFIRFYYSRDTSLQSPVQFEFIDPDQIRGDAFTSTYGIMGKEDGIKRDNRGREIEYKVWIRDNDNNFKNVEIPARSKKTGRVFMLHGFSQDYAGQGRGFSRLHFALQEFQNITDFTTAQIKKAINESSLFMSIENKELDPSNPMATIASDYGSGPAAEQFGSSATQESDTSVDDSSRLPQCYELPEATLNVPGSTVVANLQRGDTLKEFGKSAPAESFDKFVDAFTGFLSAGTGMPLEVLLMKFNENFSASRGALLLFWRVVLIWREEMAADFLNILYEMWLSEEIASGRVKAPGWSDPRLRAAWKNAEWIGAPAPDIDPSKTSKARKDNIEMGITSVSREARGLNGSDAKTNKEKLRKELEDFPVVPWSKGNNGNGNNGNNPDNNATGG